MPNCFRTGAKIKNGKLPSKQCQVIFFKMRPAFFLSSDSEFQKISVSLQQFLKTRKNEKSNILSLLLMAASVIGANAQGSATTAQNPQDVDVLYAKNLLAVGTEAPAFPALKKGTWTVLDFWATWCPDCRREIPTVKEMFQKYGTRAKFIGVSMDTDKQKLDNYTQANGVEWEQYSEFKKWKETQISKDYKISWLPTMYLINPEGKVVYTTVLAERMAKKLAEIFPEK